MKFGFAEKILCADFLHDSLRGNSDALPPYLTTSFERENENKSPVSSAISSFEYLSLATRAHALFSLLPVEQWLTGEAMTEIRADVLSKFIQKVVTLNAELGAEHRATSIKLVGCKIVGSLNLSKVNLGISLRLIGCWVDGAILLDRSTVHTLDLSGSVISNGVSGNYLKASGALRARRAVFTGPVDFGGATIESTVDFTDAILLPHNTPPPEIAFVGDRGMLNLALTEIKKDVRLNRMRLYGGANLRGANIGGSVFMSDALFRSPLACVERYLAASRITGNGNARGALVPLLEADGDLADLIWGQEEIRGQAKKKSEKAYETLDECELEKLSFSQPESAHLMEILLGESSRSADCALKAEGLTIGGSLIGRSGRFAGRVRMKHIRMDGTLSLSGSRFKSPRASRDQIRVMVDTSLLSDHPLYKMYAKIQKNLHQREQSDRDEFVLDLQLSTISGALELENDGRHPNRKAGKKILTTELVEKLSLARENPIKFFPIFFRGSGDPYFYIQRLKNRMSASSSAKFDDRENEALKLYQGLEQEALSVDEQFYIRRRNRKTAGYDSVLDKELGALRYDEDPVGLGADELTREQRIAKVCFEHGNINSTIVNGEICLAGARIKGSARFTGLIANAFSIERSAKPVISLDNVDIGGDCDFRDSVGISSIQARQAKIEGSLMFADEPSFGLNSVRGHLTAKGGHGQNFDPERDEWSPIRRRSLHLADHTDSKKVVSVGKYNFERAWIGGNSSFVFDPETGPTLDLAYTFTRGKLSIIPARGGIDLSQEAYEALVREPLKLDPAYEQTPTIGLRYRGVLDSRGSFKRSARKMLSLRTRIAAVFETLNKSLGPGDLNRRRKNGPNDKIEKETIWNLQRFESSGDPIIDLRNARCAVLMQPPTAWPKRERLIIEGLRYNQTRGAGPLVPFRRTAKELLQDKRRNATGYLSIVAVMGPTLILALLWVTWSKEYLDARIGYYNAVMAVSLGAIVLFTLVVKLYTWPKVSRANPLALHWLLLQRRFLNPRKVQKAMHPLEPYSIAASTLRASGRVRSANLVELARLRRRTEYVSKRTAFPLVALLRCTDWIIEYGYAPLRAAACAAIVVILGSCIGHYEGQQGRVIAADHDLLVISAGAGEKLVCSNNRDRLGSYPEFNSFAYTLDVFVPFLDLQQDSRWVLVSNSVDGNDCEGVSGPNALFSSYAFFWRVLGWLFTTIITIAVVARIETIVARNEELPPSY